MTKISSKSLRKERRLKSLKSFLHTSWTMFWGGTMFSLGMWVIFGPVQVALQALVGK